MPSSDPHRPPGGLGQGFPRPFGTKYLLLHHIATGGMADVFLARQIGGAGFVKDCVIKRILPHLGRDQHFVAMFLDEARVCARLNHPHIAQVYDHGRIGDDYFMAMEFVDGVDLDHVLDVAYHRGEKRLPFPIAARVVAGVAEGLAHAHNCADENGNALALVHRDVTPSNICVSFEGVPKLLDFGVAKVATRQRRTDVGIIKGKVPYMSPEQVQGEPLDGRSDLFALGAILYELTTGDKPFLGDNATTIGLRILHDEPTPPTLLEGGYPEELEAIVMSALAKRPAERTPTARAMQMQLERFLVNARTPVTSYDVAHYLGERIQRKKLTGRVMPPSEALVDGPAGSASMEVDPEKQADASGPVTIGEPALLGDLDGGGRRSMGGGGGPWMAAAMVGLVLAVAAGFVLLRAREVKAPPPTAEPGPADPRAIAPVPPVPTTAGMPVVQPAVNPAPGAAPPAPTATTNPAPAPQAPVVIAAPAAAPAPPSVKAVQEPAVPSPPAGTAVPPAGDPPPAPANPPPTAVAKPPQRASATRAPRPRASKDGTRALPRLPTLPPP